jgi:hypothetical protein
VSRSPAVFARVQWDTWRPPGWFDDAEFAATAQSFTSPDWVAIALNAYRARYQKDEQHNRATTRMPGAPARPNSSTPALMVQGGSDFCDQPQSLIQARVEGHAGDMTSDLLLRSASHDARPWDCLLARIRAPSLDRQIAAGCPPATSRLLAIRARQIVSPAGRRGLAEGWEHVLDLARRPPVPRPPRGPLCRDLDSEGCYR